MRNLVDCIKVYKGALSSAFCDALLAEYPEHEFGTSQVMYDNTDEASILNGVSSYVNEGNRRSRAVMLSNQNIVYRQELDKGVFDAFTKAIADYKIDFPGFRSLHDTGYELIRYDVGGFFRIHVDQFTSGTQGNIGGSPDKRILSCVALVNNDFEGGELAFFEGEDRYVPELNKGDVVLFPSTFLFPHEVTKVTKGIRYSIVTWFI